MAVGLFSHSVSDLCLGKPPLRTLPATATVFDAISAIRSSGDGQISVWSCDHTCALSDEAQPPCNCLGKVCMVDVICHLCKEENLSAPTEALKAPVSEILPKMPDNLVKHVESSSSLVEAIDMILQGAQNLVVPIQTRTRRKKQTSPTMHNGVEYCWVTQEDVIKFLLNSISLFSPIPTLPIDTLDLITTDVLAVNYHAPASSALNAISLSLLHQTSVAVVEGDGTLIGEISPFTLACCDETVAAAISTLSAGDLMAYIDGGGPPEDLVRLVCDRLKERNLKGMLEEFTVSNFLGSSSSGSSSSCSSDEESLARVRMGGRRYSRSSSYSARMVRRSEAIVCHRKSSLVAVMIQAIAHRVNYVWVIEEDCSLVGVVTFSSMLEVFREHLQTMA